MPKEMKYIIVRMDCPWDKKMDEKEVAIVFPKCLVHKHVARVHKIGEQVIVSAGFCTLCEYDTCDAKAYGFSESLKLGSRPEDPDIINRCY